MSAVSEPNALWHWQQSIELVQRGLRAHENHETLHPLRVSTLNAWLMLYLSWDSVRVSPADTVKQHLQQAAAAAHRAVLPGVSREAACAQITIELCGWQPGRPAPALVEQFVDFLSTDLTLRWRLWTAEAAAAAPQPDGTDHRQARTSRPPHTATPEAPPA